MRDIKELTYGELELVEEFIREYVDTIRNERRSFNTRLATGGGKVGVDTERGDEGEFIESYFENFWCDKCEMYIVPEHGSMKQDEATKLLFEHVMKHLGIE